VIRDAWSTAQQWAEQNEIIAPIMSSVDAREGAAAFLEKQTPHWKGR
jgi:enoyl-CoA hydratase